jgi:hypothetical protein
MASSLALWDDSNGLHGWLCVHSDVSLKRALVLAWDLEKGRQWPDAYMSFTVSFFARRLFLIFLVRQPHRLFSHSLSCLFDFSGIGFGLVTLSFGRQASGCV